MGIAPPAVAIPQAKAAAARGFSLDQDSARVHETLAAIATWIDWDWEAAWPEWQRAIELNPSAANAQSYYAHFLAIMGRPQEALPHGRRAVELDPFNPNSHAMYAVVLFFNRRYDDAMVAAYAALEIQPDHPIARSVLQWGLASKGMHEEALEEFRQSIAHDAEQTAAFERGRATGGFEGAHRATAEVMAARYDEEGWVEVGTEGIAMRFMNAGDIDRAIDWLETGFQLHDPNLPYLGLPVWDPLRPHPRFQELLQKMNLPVD
jgi:tetratricopeptide (TPR) repeat protein